MSAQTGDRLYFIVRTFVMGQLGSGLTYLAIAIHGPIGLGAAVAIGASTFAVSLLITRLLDSQITMATRRIVGWLAVHKSVADFMVNHL